MQEKTKKILEKRLEIVNDNIVKKQYKVSNWKAFYFTGLVGLSYGVLSMHSERVIAGGIIAVSGLLFKMINDFSLGNFKSEKEWLEYGLSHPDKVIEHHFYDDDSSQKGGKHFKKWLTYAFI